MKLTKRPVRRGTPKQCVAPTCTRSAGYDIELFDGYHDLLCAAHAKEWAKAYDNALFGWPDEPAHKIATDYRSAA